MKLYTQSFTQRTCQPQVRRACPEQAARQSGGEERPPSPLPRVAARQTLIATQILDFELTRSQHTRKHFLIAAIFDDFEARVAPYCSSSRVSNRNRPEFKNLAIQ